MGADDVADLCRTDATCPEFRQGRWWHMPQTRIRVFRNADGSAPLIEWLGELRLRKPKVYAKCVQRVLMLSRSGFELRRPLADVLRDGVHELRLEAGRVNYRILYFFCGENVACLSHGITKERAVPDGEIDEAVRRKELVEADPEGYTAEWG